MLRTALAELRARLPDPQFAIDPTVGPYSKRAELGLHQIVPPRRWVGRPYYRVLLAAQKAVGPLLTKGPLARVTDLYGATVLDRIDALVDVSGFAFTDLWGQAPMRDFARLAQTYDRRGCPVVMMPQGFGPFRQPGSGDAMRDVLASVHRVYARDAVSRQHVADVTPHPERLDLRPDITLFFPKRLEAARPAAAADHSCIIPNVRMLDQGQTAWQACYEERLVAMAEALARHGEEVVFLIHDTTGQDKVLAQRLLTRIDVPGVRIEERQDPVELKRFIARSSLVVTSRYHGAIAAFASAVPSLCMGWAHKYDMLYRDFGFSGHMIAPETPEDHIAAQMDRLLDAETNDGARAAIIDRLADMHRANKAMWDEVAALLMRRTADASVETS